MKKTLLPDILKNRFKETDLNQINKYIFEIKKNTLGFKNRLGKNKIVLVISGPSGSGKDSVVSSLPKEFMRFKTCTTRLQRPGEMKKDPYVRLSQKEFKKGVARGEFLEYNFFDNHYYGSRYKEIFGVVAKGKIPVFRPDPSGAKNVVEMAKKDLESLKGLKFVYFYITPPSIEIIKERIFKRDVQIFTDLTKRKKAEKKAIQRLERTQKQDLNLLIHAHYLAINYTGQLEEVSQAIANLFLKINSEVL